MRNSKKLLPKIRKADFTGCRVYAAPKYLLPRFIINLLDVSPCLDELKCVDQKIRPSLDGYLR